jgi:hypothetical protein
MAMSIDAVRHVLIVPDRKTLEVLKPVYIDFAVQLRRRGNLNATILEPARGAWVDGDSEVIASAIDQARRTASSVGVVAFGESRHSALIAAGVTQSTDRLAIVGPNHVFTDEELRGRVEKPGGYKLLTVYATYEEGSDSPEVGEFAEGHPSTYKISASSRESALRKSMDGDGVRILVDFMQNSPR